MPAFEMFRLLHSPPPLTDVFNPLNAELNPIRHLLALVGARHIVHVSRIRFNQFKQPRPARENRFQQKALSERFLYTGAH